MASCEADPRLGDGRDLGLALTLPGHFSVDEIR